MPRYSDVYVHDFGRDMASDELCDTVYKIVCDLMPELPTHTLACVVDAFMVSVDHMHGAAGLVSTRGINREMSMAIAYGVVRAARIISPMNVHNLTHTLVDAFLESADYKLTYSHSHGTWTRMEV